MKQQLGVFSLSILFWVTIANYIAQVPYYLHNYYFPYHILPTPSSIVLLGLTLLWFLAGYIGIVKDRKYGYPALLSFLLVETLFYFHSLVFGAFFFQMQNPNPIIKIVFIVGYISGVTAMYYFYMLVSSHKK